MRSKISRLSRTYNAPFTAAALGLCLLLSACGNTYEIGSSTTETLDDFAATAAANDELSITTVTDFDWDYLYAFNEGAVKSEIDTTIGAELFGQDSDRLTGLGTLLVFVSGDEVAHAVQTKPPLKLLTLDGHGYAAGSAIATLSDTDAGWLVLSDATTS